MVKSHKNNNLISKYLKYLMSILNLACELMISMHMWNAHEIMKIRVKLVLNIFIASISHRNYQL